METSNTYLTFLLKNELYAISVSNIKEVLEVPRITQIPRMPEFMRGVINLRGEVVPILDLRIKFGIGNTEVTANTAIIVLEIENEGSKGKLCVGIFADVVQKVITIEDVEIKPAPKLGMSINTNFITGMGHVEENFVIILNIREILTTEELENMEVADECTAD